MRRLFPALVLLLGCWTGPVLAQELKIDRHSLSNGLTVYTHEDHTAPLMSFYVFYKVGSVNERIGITGVSHLFEHMMFNGSSRYKPKEFDFKLEGAGGSSNGYTDRDMTVYLETFPPEALDLVLDLESDRMATLAITSQNLEQERGIVKEERRLRTDNDNEGKLDELLYLLAYVSHPYRNPVVGFMDDLEHITLEDTKAYYATHYTPNNAIVVITGDFRTPEVMTKVRKAFEPVKQGPTVPAVYGFEPVQEGERRATLEREAELPMLMIGWHVPGAPQEAEVAALDVLQTVLSRGESSRLYQSLIYRTELAAQVQAFNYTLRGPALFTIALQVAPDKKVEEAEAALYRELEALATTPIDAAELQTARNQLRADAFRSLQTMDGRANQIGVHALVYGDPTALKRLIALREKVTAADVQRVAKQYFTRENRTVITLIPQKSVGQVLSLIHI